MTEDQLEHFRKLLQARRQELLEGEEVTHESTRPVELDQASVGRLSRMDAMQVQAMAIEAQRRREMQLKRIQAALARIDSKEYGLCLSCEEEIAVRRLEIDPTTTLCIDCASSQEKR